eukprot:6202186-Pleurochrysis_carterae.AAC.3
MARNARIYRCDEQHCFRQTVRSSSSEWIRQCDQPPKVDQIGTAAVPRTRVDGLCTRTAAVRELPGDDATSTATTSQRSTVRARK